ncbi:MAG: 30S ribosomal protein S13 [Candidatus Gracilibacteria bacterium]|jgi:small subunit ribosomal protein S13
MAIVRIAGINLPNEKRIEAGLTTLHGVGRKLSARILRETNIDRNKKVKDLTDTEISSLRDAVQRFPLEGDLKRQVALNIKRLQEIGSYRGYRHKRGLPTRGQRTRYNCRTRKGKRKTVANKKVTTK